MFKIEHRVRKLQRRLAKYMVLQCFRNSMLEDLHAGTSPSSASGDYSDVTVSSPYGAIPWSKVSRLNDDEMKRLMTTDIPWNVREMHLRHPDGHVFRVGRGFEPKK